MKRILILFFFVLNAVVVNAQLKSRDTGFTPSFKVAVIAPLYLDTIFTDSYYTLGTKNIPSYVIPGLDFYNGVMLAIDSLNKEKINVDVEIIDSKSKTNTLNRQIHNKLLNADLYIASFNDRAEMSMLANYAKQQQKPVISATYPTASGISNNEYFVMINPTLQTQLEAIVKYVQKNHSVDKIIYFKRAGNNEDAQLKKLFEQYNSKAGKHAVKPIFIDVPANVTKDNITSKMDSTKNCLVIGGSLNTTFAIKLVKALNALPEKYESTVVGMPTWDGVRFGSERVPIIFSTPYNYLRTDKKAIRIANLYKRKVNGKANDMVFKGFETMYHFTKLYNKNRNSFLQNISMDEFHIFNEYSFEPCMINGDNNVDYLENKKIYFIQKLNNVHTLMKN